MVWSHIKRNIIKLEIVQGTVIKKLNKSTYGERLRMLKIYILENRIEREGGDLINTYRIINSIENVDKECFQRMFYNLVLWLTK